MARSFPLGGAVFPSAPPPDAVPPPYSAGCDLPPPPAYDSVRPSVLCNCGQGALFYCHECRRGFCVTCHPRHVAISQFRSHRCVTIGTETFCKRHLLEAVIHYCGNCQFRICGECLMDDHATHRTTPLTPAQLQPPAPSHPDSPQRHLLAAITDKSEQLSEARAHFRDVIDPLRAALREFDACLESVAGEFETRTCADMLELAVLETRVKQGSPAGGATPHYSALVNVPRVNPEMAGICKVLHEMTDAVGVSYTSEIVGGKM